MLANWYFTIVIVIIAYLMNLTNSLSNEYFLVKNNSLGHEMAPYSNRSKIIEKRSPMQSVKNEIFGSLAFVVTASLVGRREQFCSINVKDMTSMQHPLFINPQDHTKFVYPVKTGLIKLQEGQSIHLACSGIHNYLETIPGNPQYRTAKCILGQIFEIDNGFYNLQKVLCQTMPRYRILKNIYGREYELTDYRIGFHTDISDTFAEVLYIHRDETEMLTQYVRSTISKSIAAAQPKDIIYDVDQLYCCGNYDHINMDELYWVGNQISTLSSQFFRQGDLRGSPYFREKEGFLFTKRYLSSRASFVYKAETSASQVYLNIEPQWQNVYTKRWSIIDRMVIDKAKQIEKDLIVYTGTLGKLALTDYGEIINEKFYKRSIYLHKRVDLLLFPVPLYFWKLVYDPISNKGDVFVTVNNPYEINQQEHRLCERPWINFYKINMRMDEKPWLVSKGYTYSCTIDDFIRYNALTLHGMSAETNSQSLFGRPSNVDTPYHHGGSTHSRPNNPSTSQGIYYIHDELR